MLEVAARGGRLMLVTDAEGAEGAAGQRLMTFIPPTVPATVAPFVYALPVQFIAYTARSSWAHRRRSAAQSDEIGDGGVDAASRWSLYAAGLSRSTSRKRTDCYTAVTAWKGEPC
jgi:hypothetical protein